MKLYVSEPGNWGAEMVAPLTAINQPVFTLSAARVSCIPSAEPSTAKEIAKTDEGRINRKRVGTGRVMR